MAKSKWIGNVSFSDEGYQNFVSLTKDEQVTYLSDNMSPKNPAKAEKLLKRIPNGDGTGSTKPNAKSNTTKVRAESSGDSSNGQRNAPEEGKD